MINVWRVKSRVESGGHDVPEEKIITRYDRALKLIKDLVKICDVCHIYDNSGNRPFRIFKKRKEEIYFDECSEWYLEDIQMLTAIDQMIKRNLN
jgi:predicted ABC-type ATPase